MAIQSYRDLDIWKEAVALSLTMYRITSTFPQNERYGLVSQMRRCSVSVPSNIAEGHARLSTREYLRHVSIALGSLAELETQLHIALELRYVQTSSAEQVVKQADRLGKQLRNLTKSLRSRLSKSL